MKGGKEKEKKRGGGIFVLSCSCSFRLPGFFFLPFLPPTHPPFYPLFAEVFWVGGDDFVFFFLHNKKNQRNKRNITLLSMKAAFLWTHQTVRLRFFLHWFLYFLLEGMTVYLSRRVSDNWCGRNQTGKGRGIRDVCRNPRNSLR